MPVRSIPTCSRKNNGGFTLLEVLLAFVVFALSFATVLEILSGSMRNTVRAREYTEVALIAQSVMDQLGLEIPVEQGTTVSGESGDYEWEVSINSFGESSGNGYVVEISEMTATNSDNLISNGPLGEPPREKSNSFSTVRAMLANRELRGG